MDGLMCIDIRLGVMLRTEMEREGRGGTYRRKDGNGTPMCFCEFLVNDAGGFRRFFEDYVFEPDRG